MKAKIIILTLLLALSLGIVLPTLAEEDAGIKGLLNRTAGAAGYNPNEDAEENKIRLATIMGGVVNAFLSLLGIIFMVYTVYGGYLWMTAGGSEEQVTKARAIIRNGIIGLIIIFAVYGIYLVVASIFGLESTPPVIIG